MLIAGAKGHAKEILDIFAKNQQVEKLVFFDDVSIDIQDKLYGYFPVLKSSEEAAFYFSEISKPFVLGIGIPALRRKLSEKLSSIGGELTSVISGSALIAGFNVELGKGLNIMHQAFISNDVSIGEGSLINARVNIHHDVLIGTFCEISPSVTITGGVKIGNQVSIGAGATILPKLTIGDNAIIGAGAVVTKSVNSNEVVVGNPARVLRVLNS